MPRVERLGGLILLVSLFLPWYGNHAAVVGTEQGIHVLVSGFGTAWEAFSGFDIVLAVLAVAVVLTPRGRALVGLAALVVVAHLLLDRPEEGFAPPVYGAWIGLAGALLAAWPSTRDWRVLAAGAGGVALLVSLSTRWYLAPWPNESGIEFPPSDWDRFLIVPRSGWDALLVVDLALAALALLVLGVALTRSATVQSVARAVGWLAIVLVAARIVFEPDDTKLAYGAYVALAAAALAWAATWVPQRAAA
ncbi:hypothetical protein OJ997_11590 [Solirubrobacter phytolaccae]|uniref:Uncharacterized protein n=1 Tax=Solirubrobacter phytolaccae TaxID=1404360 RepID=A0A9X3N9J9_9ACTN|nr:hypothetical protein [Solirubrobacter phytolaccae]MDA0180939.1 hypothetical protein [Solirubrobacter phytolaccae]